MEIIIRCDIFGMLVYKTTAYQSERLNKKTRKKSGIKAHKISLHHRSVAAVVDDL